MIRGGIWVLALNLSRRGFELIRTIVLARLLLPSDFGLFGIAGLAMSATDAFTGTGFHHALVQKKGSVGGYLDTAWVVSGIRGLLLTGVVFLAAPLVATFFENGQATAVLRVSAISLAVTGFSNIGIIYFQKDLRFNRQIVLDFSVTFTSLAVGVTLAFVLRSVWALVYGSLAGAVVKFILSYRLHPYRPKLHFNTAKARELFGYGKWIFASSVIWFLVLQGDDIFVGKMLGLTFLGFYQLAYRIANIPATELSTVITKVTFPAYAKLQDNMARLRDSFLKVLHLTAVVLFPLAAGIIVLAPDFTFVFLGSKWMPMVPAIKVLALGGLVRAIGVTTGAIFLGVGRPEISTRGQVARLFVLAVLIYPFTSRWGIVGTSFAVLLSSLATTIHFSIMALRIAQCPGLSFAKAIVLPLCGSGTMIWCINILRNTLNEIGFYEISLLICVGAFTYLTTMYLFHRFLGYQIKPLLKECLASFNVQS